LTSIIIPGSVTSFGDWVFSNCSSNLKIYGEAGSNAETYANDKVIIFTNLISVLLNGNTLDFDVPPQIINDCTMVPMRQIFGALGAEVSWDGETKTIISKKGATTVILTVDSTNATVIPFERNM